MTNGDVSPTHLGKTSPKGAWEAGIVVLACVMLLGCNRERAPESGPVAHVGDVAVSLAELDLYLELNLPPEDEAGSKLSRKESDRVKSRLLDALLNEKIYLAEAERLNVEVSDREVTAHVGRPTNVVGAESPASLELRRPLVRQRLMVQKLLDLIARQQPPPGESEIRAHVKERMGEKTARRRLRLRALRLDSPETAGRLDDLIRKGQMSFADAVATHGSGPDQGAPLELFWDSLSEDLHQALGDLKPGQVSRPVDFRGDTFLFQLEAWLDDPRKRNEDLRRQARELLERQIRARAQETLLYELRKRTPARIHEKRLPFRYQVETGPEVALLPANGNRPADDLQ